MSDNKLLSRITMNPEVCFGKPTVRNMRYPVQMILELLASGMADTEIVDDHHGLELDDIKACLIFASQLMNIDSISEVVAA